MVYWPISWAARVGSVGVWRRWSGGWGGWAVGAGWLDRLLGNRVAGAGSADWMAACGSGAGWVVGWRAEDGWLARVGLAGWVAGQGSAAGWDWAG